MSIHTYIPQDRLRSIAENTRLPDRTSGSALFADISGFTALTESLERTFGPRRGTEELSKQLETVYSALIEEIEKFGGSVISFAGDSMLCWFDDMHGSAPPRATACAFAMQEVMKLFHVIVVGDSPVALALKTAIASGSARRFVVGDPQILKWDTVAGMTVVRTSIAEHLAQKGDILLDEASVNALGDSLTIREWRTDEATQLRCAVATQFNGSAASPSLPAMLSMPPHKLMPWMHYAVFEREQNDQETFLTEFRPCAAMFVRFMGIDYESDAAEAELDAFICQVQEIVARHGGIFLQLTIGDKGSYAHINFGALNAHEDDARRAVNTALELIKSSELQLQIGITQGPMRVGSYGGETRKVFGALGDDVNLAARLMTTAGLGEILLSGHVYQAVADQFTFEPRPPLPVKGKAEPLPVFALTGRSRRRAVRLQEPNYSLPMVGRIQDLQIINDRLDLAAKGQGQVIAIVADAGLGKSRLVAEVIRSARRKGFIGYGGACQSDGIHTPYQAWKSIWQAFFDVDPDMPLRKQVRNIEGEIEDIAPQRVDAMPLLNVVLDLNIPENEFTKNLEPMIRQSALHALLEDCLKAAAQDGPILIVIEDLHWVDALSHDLLEELAKALSSHAVCFLLSHRLSSAVGGERLQAARLEVLPQFTRIELHELTQAEAESAIRAKLAQLYPARGSTLPEGLVDTLMARAQGNPFYLEELLNYVRDRGLDPSDLQRIELPDSLHTLILSRIDRLSEQEKTTLRVASIVGRLFRAKWLTGYYPELGSVPQVKATLETLESLDITPLDSPEPELAYLFKHIVTHEVTYESLPFATRAKLHEQLGQYLENVETEAVPLDAIAFHYGRSENREKQCEYLRKAAQAAQRDFANDAALEYYGKLLSLLEDGDEQTQIHLQRGSVLEFIGKYDEAEADYQAALELGKDDITKKAGMQLALGRLNRLRGDYESALAWLAQATMACRTLEDTAGLARALIETGMVLYRQDEYAQARELLNKGLVLAREAGDKWNTAQALINLGLVASSQADYAAAQTLYEESITLGRETGDQPGIALSLGYLGIVVWYQGDSLQARALLEESLSMNREMGDKKGMARNLLGLGIVMLAAKQVGPAEVQEARSQLIASLRLHQEIGVPFRLISSLIGMAKLAIHEGDARRSANLLGSVESFLEVHHSPMEARMKRFHEQTRAAARQQLGEPAFQSAWEQGSRWPLELAVKKALEESRQ